MMKRYSLILIALTCLSLISGALHAATITARTDRNPVQMNESIRLIFEATGSVDDDPDFSPLEKDFDIINQSQSSNISIINGSINRQKTWTLIIMPRQPGVFTIPSIEFGKDSSPQLRLIVKAVSQGATTENQPFFTELKLDTQQTYVQGQIIVTQRIYSSSNIARYGFGEIKTSGPDKVIETIGDEKQYQTKLGNTPYLVIERSYAMFPQSSGTLEIEPAMVEASVVTTSSNYNDPFRRNTTIKRARSEGHSITVKDVPASFRGKTWLPAAEVQLVEQWSDEDKQFKVGEPITRTLSIFADGLMGAQLPKIPLTEVDGLKQYPDKPVLNDNKKTDGIIGGRQEKVAIIPTRAGSFTLPAIELPWWNTKTGKLEIARLPQKTITVAGAASTPNKVLPSSSTTPSSTETSDLRLPTSDSKDSSGWMWFSLLLASGWLFTTVYFWLRLNTPKNSVTIKNRVDAQSLSKAMKQLKSACQMNQPAACKDALLNWGRQLYADQTVTSLGQLAKLTGEPLASMIQQLESSLYGRNTNAWNSTGLVDACQVLSDELNKQNSAVTGKLEPLYK